MLCRIAVALGKWPSEVESAETPDYLRLVKFYNNEPWGFQREDARFANLTAAVYRSSPNIWNDDTAIKDPETWRYVLRNPISAEELIDKMIEQFEPMAVGRIKRRGD